MGGDGETLTVLQSEHRDANSMCDGYHQGKSGKEARRFWAIPPIRLPKDAASPRARLGYQRIQMHREGFSAAHQNLSCY